ncbi:putative inorganic phosphate cotransporter isoform X2 [Leptinotarsa decemlineata]
MAQASEYKAVPTNANGDESFVNDGNRAKASELSHGPTFGKRHQQLLMMFFEVVIYNSVKHSMAICLVAMTDPNANPNKKIPTYEWTNQNMIISMYIWGYTLPQIAAGWIVTTYGPKWFMVGAMTMSSLLGLMIPTTASLTGDVGVIVCRFLQGCFHAVMPTATYTLLGKWLPVSERSRMSSHVFTGSSIGAVISMLLSGYIAGSWYGWPMVFYVYNGSGLVWAFIFCFIGSNCPGDHPTISIQEKTFIETYSFSTDKKNLSTPWIKILTSSCFWALVLAELSFIWGYYTLLSQTPAYFNYTMKINIKSNGVLSSLPLLAKWLSTYIFIYVADILISKKICSIGKTRKIMTVLSSMIPCVALIVLGNSKAGEGEKCVALLIVALGFASANYSGALVNCLDLSPNYSGVLTGINYQISMMLAALSPLSVDFFVVDKEDPEQWKYVFYLTAVIYTFSTVIYLIFGSGKVQTWNDEIQKRKNSVCTVQEDEVLNTMSNKQLVSKQDGKEMA